MGEKVGRNDPCPCGSGKKYKACCMAKEVSPIKKKFTAKLIHGGGQQAAKEVPPQRVNLMERAFGEAISQVNQMDKPPLAPTPLPKFEK